MDYRTMSIQSLARYYCDTVRDEKEIDDCENHPELLLQADEFWKWAEEEARKIRALIKANKPQ